MAIGTPVELGRTTGNSAASSTSLTVTPTLGRTVYAFISAGNGSVKPTISDTDGHTWTEVKSATNFLFGICYQTVGKGNSTTVTAVTTTSNAGTTLALVEFPGAGTDASNSGGYAGNEFDPPLINLAAFAPTSAAFLWSVVQGGSPTLSSGTTSLALTSANNRGIRTQYALTSPPNSFSWSDAFENEGRAVGIALEIKESGGAADQNITGGLFSNGNVIFAAAVALSIGGGLFTDPDTFYGAKVSQEISGSLFTNLNFFLGATVTTQPIPPVDQIDMHDGKPGEDHQANRDRAKKEATDKLRKAVRKAYRKTNGLPEDEPEPVEHPADPREMARAIQAEIKTDDGIAARLRDVQLLIAEYEAEMARQAAQRAEDAVAVLLLLS